jgi:hypothetical protein
LSNFTTRASPISIVEWTCVPPQAWASKPSSSTIRTPPSTTGGLTLNVRTSSGRSASSASGTTDACTRSPRRITALTSASNAGTSSRLNAVTLRSTRERSGAISAPLTRPPNRWCATAFTTCSRQWYRMRASRRGQSSAPRLSTLL